MCVSSNPLTYVMRSASAGVAASVDVSAYVIANALLQKLKSKKKNKQNGGGGVVVKGGGWTMVRTTKFTNV